MSTTSFNDLPTRLKNAKRRERRRRAKEQRDSGQPRRLDLRKIDSDLTLRLANQPVALPEPRLPALCPTCGSALIVFDHDERAMLLCEPCCRVWPTRADAGNQLREIVRQIIPFAEIKICRKGNEQDYQRVYYAANRERISARMRAWRESLPDQGKRYARAHYRANREETLQKQLAHYHDSARHEAEKAKRRARRDPEKERSRAAKYREENREMLREKDRAYRAANAEKEKERAAKKRATPEYQANARKWRDANRERLREKNRDYHRRKAAEKRAAAEMEQAAD